MERNLSLRTLGIVERYFAGRNFIFTLAARLQGRCRNDRYFRKTEEWEPDYGFFRAF